MNNGIVITNPIYPKAVLVWKGDNKNKMIKFFSKHFKEDYQDSIKEAFEGMTVILKNGDVLIHLTSKAGTGTIVHEAFHAVEFQLEHLGVEFTKPPNEAYSYYLDFLCKEIVNNLYQDRND